MYVVDGGHGMISAWRVHVHVHVHVPVPVPVHVHVHVHVVTASLACNRVTGLVAAAMHMHS